MAMVFIEGSVYQDVPRMQHDILVCLLEALMKTTFKTLPLLAIAAGGLAHAQVTPTIAKELVNIGRGVCVPETAQVYRPLHDDLARHFLRTRSQKRA
jgi:hypothetical protein